MSRLCVCLAGELEWRLVPFDASAGWAALEATLLREFGADPRAMSLNALGLCLRDDSRCLLARSAVSQLRDGDRLEVLLLRRTQGVPLAALTAAPFASPVTPRRRGVKREPSPARDARAAKAPSPAPSRGASPTPTPAADAAAADDDNDADEDETPPLRCFQVYERGGNALLVGEKPASALDAQFDYLAQHRVATVISLTSLPPRAVEEARRRGMEHVSMRTNDDREGGFEPEQLDAVAERIEEALQAGGVYMHCDRGRSRSPSFAMAFLMRCVGRSYTQAKNAIANAVQRAGHAGITGLAPTVLEPPTSERSLRFAVIDEQLVAYDARCKALRAEEAAAGDADGDVLVTALQLRILLAMEREAACMPTAAGVLMTTLRSAVKSSQNQVFSRLMPLIKRGLVERIRDCDPQKLNMYRLTPAGLERALRERPEAAAQAVPVEPAAPPQPTLAEAATSASDDDETPTCAMAELLRAAKAGDAARIQQLLRRQDVAAACRRLGPFDVSPLHLAVLALHADAAAALLDAGPPFLAAMRGRVDLSDRGDGLGDVRRSLPFCCTAAEVLQKRVEHHCRECLIMHRGHARSEEGRTEREQLDAMARVLHGVGTELKSEDAPLAIMPPATQQ